MPDSSDNWGVCYPEFDPGEMPEEKVGRICYFLGFIGPLDLFLKYMFRRTSTTCRWTGCRSLSSITSG